MSIRYKLVISFVILIVFSVSILGFFVANLSKNAIFKEVTEKSERITELIHNMVSVRNDLLSEKIRADAHFAKQKLSNLGEIKLDHTNPVYIQDDILPSLYAGSSNLTLDTSLVDEIEESLGAVASIFLFHDEKLIRVTTNLDYNGKRAIGTYISNDSQIFKKLKKNIHYQGNSFILDDWFITSYEPISDKDGKVIGAIALGYKALNNHLRKTLDDIKVGKTGYVYVMNSNGDVFVHPNSTGENIGDFDFSKEIIKKKNGIIKYTFQGVSKLAAYRYFEPWDWYIVTTANYEDLESPSKSILYAIFIVALIILLIGVLLAFFLSQKLVTPVNKLIECMQIAKQGDLSIQSDIHSNDEIGVLSDSFNSMIKENKRLLEETINYNKLKTEFFSNISHELKTPLNIIFSTTQLFALHNNDSAHSIDSTNFSKYVHIIKQNCYRLLRLVNNLLDITRIDTGFMTLSLANENIIEIVENITLSTSEYIKSKSRTIIFDTDIEEKIMAIDPEKIERIMLNLISNAVKFTRHGDKISVTVYDEGDHIQISVKDTGIGIPEDKLKMIFERFKQVDSLLSRRHEGSGIGLSLVKALVEMHDGKISVKSKTNEGTEFIMELPVKCIDNDSETEKMNDFAQNGNVEKIQIEFSDIYM
ncbi:Cache 3/Cache 2 fusion domain-containing protein [Wukongibacter baidiensis]|uniref:Cache 3/Cache 2 fusion domain-containing protein n=1 Tax=Wukongibacter baidiensis TaxID=1723361 RepID=UPI003D7FCC24